MKSFCESNDIIKKVKGQPTEWKKSTCNSYIWQGSDNQNLQRTLGTQKQKEKTTQLKDEGLRQFFPGSANNKESTYQCRRHKRCRFNPWSGKTPLERKWHSTPIFLLEESHGQRSLMGYSSGGSQSQTWLSDWTELNWWGNDPERYSIAGSGSEWLPPGFEPVTLA